MRSVSDPTTTLHTGGTLIRTRTKTLSLSTPRPPSAVVLWHRRILARGQERFSSSSKGNNTLKSRGGDAAAAAAADLSASSFTTHSVTPSETSTTSATTTPWEKIDREEASIPSQDATPVVRAAEIQVEPNDDVGDSTIIKHESRSESEESETGWTSSSEDEDEEGEEDVQENETVEETVEREEARAAERMRVLEAAGLLVKNPTTSSTDSSRDGVVVGDDDDTVATTEIGRSKKKTPRGPRPAAPARKRTTKKIPKPDRPLPPPPPPQPEEQMDDAYDRFVKLQREMSGKRTSAAVEESTKSPKSSSSVDADVPAPGSPSGTPSNNAQSSSSVSESRSSGLLHSLASSFRSRTGTPQPDRRATPTISGPTMVGITSSPNPSSAESGSVIASLPAASSAGSVSVGQSTWSSVMNAEVVAGLPDQERKRQEAIYELCQTESTHVRDLQTIVEVFYNNIQERNLLEDKARTVIFGNIEDVLLTAVSFLSDLEERQRSSRMYIDHVGDVISDHLPRMRAYIPYCTNQSTAAKILTTQRTQNPSLDSLLHQLQAGPGGRGLDLSSYLLTPMQRLTRYPLLLNQILKYTPQDHVDYDLISRCVRVAETILDDTNERIRENESRQRLKTLSQTLYIGDEARLDLTKPTRCLGDRKILKEETLIKAKSKTGRKLTIVLCNDLLLVLTASAKGLDVSSLYRMPAPLEEVVVRSTRGKGESRYGTVWLRAILFRHLTDSLVSFFCSLLLTCHTTDDACFQIIISGQDKINVRANSVRSAHLWMRAIDEARSVCLAALMDASASSMSPRRREKETFSLGHSKRLSTLGGVL